MPQSLETQTLVLAYEKACRQVEMTCESECARQLRLQTLLLEHEIEELHGQLAHGDERIDDLEQIVLDLQGDVKAGEKSFNTVQGSLRMKIREVDSLKVNENNMQWFK